MDDTGRAFVRNSPLAALPPPLRSAGWLAWTRRNLFGSLSDTAITLALIALLWVALPPAWNFLVRDAVWTGTDREACLAPVKNGVYGACWAFVRANFGKFLYDTYPQTERWRVDLAFLLGVLPTLYAMVPRAPGKRWMAVWLLAIYPFAGLILLTGGHFSFFPQVIVLFWLLVAGWAAWAVLSWWQRAGSGRGLLRALAGSCWLAAIGLMLSADFHLAYVETPLWGGLLVTLVVSVVGNVFPLPLGILWALGRRSNMPVIKAISIFFIEALRGVPLITVLFMASVMLPLFLPPGVHIDKLLRTLVGISLFSAAYMAEIVRGGLQALPRGQYEAADALGLGYWRSMRLVILPQALKVAIPNLVNNTVGLLQNTSLVIVIGLFDLLGTVTEGFQDQNWAGPTTPATGLVFAAFVFWLLCFGISRYSAALEHRLDTQRRH